MRVLLKNLSIFVVLALGVSMVSSCGNSQNASGLPNVPPPAVDGDAAKNDKKPSTEYPPAPKALMENQIRRLDGTTYSLNDKKGKVVLVNLWATWCGPCIGEMPHLNEMQERLGPQGFEVIGLNTDDEAKTDIDIFAEKQKLNYELGWADGKLMNEFVKLSRLQGIPQSILINRDGQLTGVFTGGSKKTIDKMKETVEKVVAN